MKFGKKIDVCVVNCLSDDSAIASDSPFVIGTGEGCGMRLDDPSALDQHCVIEAKGKIVQLVAVQPEHPDGQMIVDGQPANLVKLDPRSEYAVQVGRSLLVVRVFNARSRTAIQNWATSISRAGWIINKTAPEISSHPMGLEAVFASCEAAGLPELTPVFKGACNAGFFLRQLGSTREGGKAGEHGGAAGLDRTSQVVPGGEYVAPPVRVVAPRFLDADSGEYICPTCWLRFDRGDVMHIAVHESLFGDPVLGEDRMQRFQATRFNDRGQALDAKGLACTDFACPHCRRALPPGFFDAPHKIFSIVGAPQSGKSYYLSVLVKLLQTTLFRQFGVVFRDADPSGNAPLNEMKSQLFSAQSPAQAYLMKTQLEGEMYERLPRFDRMVRLPRPFVFSLSSSTAGKNGDCSIVFYDNAGEHFQPGQDSANTPGAQHIASSDAIFFLFDPTINPEFRKRFAGRDDPQLTSQATDQQDVILAETEVRIKKLLGMARHEKVATPMAMIIGKCDVWIEQIGSENLRDPMVDGTIDLGAIEHNSSLIRSFMMEHCPYIVANAETISSDVVYFAASAFGHTPVSFEDDKGVTRIGPDPARIAPMFVELPTLWALSKTQPELVPSFR